ncbi:ABC transporter ATP-binding protein [Blastopirellula marina]|uniref:Fe(III) dicitrate ABC transporter, ATP-binding protein n=1 Tax=Blastopirellula marina DSM 3645 TaxID=314230 RepID=A3ZPA9_9BACT|nr:ABC transporter ATP-binding protein [Blastopirellula marina]EAQ81587.1 Fe(III) dicitrate ABC transporter, ATP-binding protein [Blastopirellula marina DSM 3645]
MILEASQLSFRYDSDPILSDIDIHIGPGVSAIIGPNAAGKSTLLKCLSGILQPEGRVRLNGKDIRQLSVSEITASISYLPQEFTPQAVLTVFETVLLGRLNQLGWRVTSEVLELVERLLEELQLTSIAGRYVNELSGGQMQMVSIAQALVRQPAVLLMDEPTSNLDLRRQFDVCGFIRQLTDSRGLSTAIALHDLNMAARFADTIYVLENGRVRCQGEPVSVLTEEMITEVYRVESRVTIEPSGRPHVAVLGPCSQAPTRET